jgi:L-ascorbate metabolism protein UlaG (beta-lactamase superfamily)
MGFKVFGKNPSGKRLVKAEQSSNYRGGSFQNLEGTVIISKNISYLKILKDYLNKSSSVKPAKKIPSITNNLKAYSFEKPTLVWFGHSSYAIFYKTFSMLVDPVLKANASPFKFFGKPFDGSDIIDVKDLPNIEIVVITHDHYDHLSYSTICELRGKCKKFIVPLGVGEHLEYWGVEPGRIIELDWWQQEIITSEVSIIVSSARHFSGRTLIRNKTLWCSFILMMNGLKVYLGGDSGYGVHFKTIGEKYGPFDLAILECGQYGKGWPHIHMLPEETVMAALDLKAQNLMPIHWGRYTLSLHPWNESIKRAITKAKDVGIRITAPRIGKCCEIGNSMEPDEWWNFE